MTLNIISCEHKEIDELYLMLNLLNREKKFRVQKQYSKIMLLPNTGTSEIEYNFDELVTGETYYRIEESIVSYSEEKKTITTVLKKKFNSIFEVLWWTEKRFVIKGINIETITKLLELYNNTENIFDDIADTCITSDGNIIIVPKGTDNDIYLLIAADQSKSNFLCKQGEKETLFSIEETDSVLALIYSFLINSQWQDQNQK